MSTTTATTTTNDSSSRTSSFQSCFETAIEMNNRAAYHLSEDDDEEFIIDCFSEAIGFLKTYVDGIERVVHERALMAIKLGINPTTVVDPQSVASETAALASNFHMEGLLCMPLVSGECSGRYDPSSHALCDNPIVIHSRLQEETTTSVDIQVQKNILPLYISCILMNLAIAHHRYAIKKDDVMMFRKAYFLYTSVYRQLASPISTALEPVRSCCTSLNLCTAALNNLGDICHHQSRIGIISHIASNLQGLLLTLHQQHYQDQHQQSRQQFFCKKDLHAIVMNLMVWKSPLLPAAA